MTADAQAIAQRLVEARRTRTLLEDFPGAVPTDLAGAYLIQDRAIAAWNDVIVGWKVGLILGPEGTPAGRFLGPIWAESLVEAPVGDVPLEVRLQPGDTFLEAEWVAELVEGVPDGEVLASVEAIRELPVRWHLGVELCSSPVAALRTLGPFAVCADFGINSGLVLAAGAGSGVRPDVEVTTVIDGGPAVAGDARRVPGGPETALAAAIAGLRDRGHSIPAGLRIATGALTGLHPVVDGSHVVVTSGADCIRLRVRAGGV